MKSKIDIEENRVFNQPKANANFAFWVKADCWALDEAIALSLGKNPKIVTWKIVEPYTLISPFAKEFAKRRELAQRAVAAGRFTDTVSPSVFVSWAIEKILDVPPELELLLVPVIQAVANDEFVCAFAEQTYNGEPIDWQTWLVMQNITPQQAAKLVFCIDPIRWNGESYKQGAIPNELRIKIERCAQALAGYSQAWTLSSIVQSIGTDGVPYTMKMAVNDAPQSAPAADVAKRVPVATQQNNAIINWLQKNQHNPQKIPVPPKGKAGIKSDCRNALCANSRQLFQSKKIFDTAWERLRANGKIMDAK